LKSASVIFGQMKKVFGQTCYPLQEKVFVFYEVERFRIRVAVSSSQLINAIMISHLGY